DGITLCLRRDAGRNASLAHRYNAFGGLWGCYDQIFGPRRHLPKLGNGLCGHSHASVYLDAPGKPPSAIWRAATLLGLCLLLHRTSCPKSSYNLFAATAM